MSVRPLSVMQFNIEYGGLGVNFDSVPKAIEAAQADVVAVQEGCGQMARVAASLGWEYFDVRTQVASRFPLLNPGSGDGAPVYVEVEPGRIVAVINVHPPSRGYGPSRLARGVPQERVMRRELKVRTSALAPSLAHAQTLIADGVPVVLLGDFNTPSHLDWTPGTVGLREHVRAPFSWPTTVAAEEVGLVDVYRQQYPDPALHPGLTWPADRPHVEGYNPARSGQSADRIDLMYAGPSARPTSVRIVGEPGSGSDIAVDPWPSDHRALVATFELEPAPAPAVVDAARIRNRIDDDVILRYHAPDPSRSRIVANRGDATRRVTCASPLAGASGKLTVPAARLGLGEHDIALVTDDDALQASTTIWVAAQRAEPRLLLSRSRYQVGEAIAVRWQYAPGNRADWIAVFDRGADPANTKRRIWTYTGATVAGQHTLDGSLQPRRWPLPEGEYTAHLLLDDVWESLAQADFTVA